MDLKGIQVILPCGCDQSPSPEHRSGSRLVACHVHGRRWKVTARQVLEFEVGREYGAVPAPDHTFQNWRQASDLNPDATHQ